MALTGKWAPCLSPTGVRPLRLYQARENVVLHCVNFVATCHKEAATGCCGAPVRPKMLNTHQFCSVLHCIAGFTAADSTHTQQYKHTEDRRLRECVWTFVWYHPRRRQLWWRLGKDWVVFCLPEWTWAQRPQTWTRMWKNSAFGWVNPPKNPPYTELAPVLVHYVTDILELIHSKNFLKMLNRETSLLLLKIQTFIIVYNTVFVLA